MINNIKTFEVEVYGELGETGKFTESLPLLPNSPVSVYGEGALLQFLIGVRLERFIMWEGKVKEGTLK
jgi:hypothetical protein